METFVIQGNDLETILIIVSPKTETEKNWKTLIPRISIKYLMTFFLTNKLPNI